MFFSQIFVGLCGACRPVLSRLMGGFCVCVDAWTFTVFDVRAT